MPKSEELNALMVQTLEGISPVAGFYTEINGVYGNGKAVPDRAPRPYILVRIDSDRRVSNAGRQATRLRTYALEVVFSKTATDDELNRMHVDVLRALGFGRDPFERRFPGLVEEEDEASYDYAQSGTLNRSLTIAVGVTYVATYD